MSQNPPKTDSTRPVIPTGQELFDAIMHHIEPELTSSEVGGLKEKYKNETAGEKALRMKRYSIAFERYDQAYGDYIGTLGAQVERYRKQSFQGVELEDRERDKGILQVFEQAILGTT